MKIARFVVPFAACLAGIFVSIGADWPQFRGASGTSLAAESNLPMTWNDDQGIVWKARLPGHGASSPIILGDRVYVTCYSGYGVDRENPGKTDELVRNLICLNKADGKTIWSTDVRTSTPEARYGGQMTQHGYASNTPATDGKQIFVFLGTGGVYAFDMQGKKTVALQCWYRNRRLGLRQFGSPAWQSCDRECHH